MVLEKLKTEKNNQILQAKQNKLNEEIIEYELQKFKKKFRFFFPRKKDPYRFNLILRRFFLKKALFA